MGRLHERRPPSDPRVSGGNNGPKGGSLPGGQERRVKVERLKWRIPTIIQELGTTVKRPYLEWLHRKQNHSSIGSSGSTAAARAPSTRSSDRSDAPFFRRRRKLRSHPGAYPKPSMETAHEEPARHPARRISGPSPAPSSKLRHRNSRFQALSAPSDGGPWADGGMLRRPSPFEIEHPP